MAEQPFDADALINAMAPLLGLTIIAEQRPGVRLHLDVTARLAADVVVFPLDDDSEPAPVFVP